MRKIYVHCSTGYCGSDLNECIEVPEDMSDGNISAIVGGMTVENAQSYGYEEHPVDCDCEECVENGGSAYSNDQAEGYWEDWDEEKHSAKCF